MAKKHRNKSGLEEVKDIFSETEKVSLVLEKLTGLTLDDVIRQVCSVDTDEYSRREYKNMLKIQKYFSGKVLIQ